MILSTSEAQRLQRLKTVYSREFIKFKDVQNVVFDNFHFNQNTAVSYEI